MKARRWNATGAAKGGCSKPICPRPKRWAVLPANGAVARHGARRPKTGAYPVLYDERVASGLIGHLVAAINGVSIARGSSWLLRAMGEQVLPKCLSLIEDPHRTRSSASRPFDAEGLPTRARNLVADGVLQGWVLDLASARKLGMESTANAMRGTSSPPSPGTTNWALTQGTASRADLIATDGHRAAGDVADRVHHQTPIRAIIRAGASGFWVDNGEIVYPVNECHHRGQSARHAGPDHPGQ